VLQTLDGPLLLTPMRPDTAFTADLISALPEQVTLVIADGPQAAPLIPTVVRVHGDQWTVTQAGCVPAEMLQALMPTTVLFVCTGNTCRSPMAEALCKKLLADRLACSPRELPQRGFLVLSAGLAAMMGREASPEAVLVASEYGADLSSHQSQPLSADLLARADYLFTMTNSHLRALLPFCQDWSPRPRLLAGNGQDVPDPMGAELQVYRECAQQIFQCLQECLPDIQLL
jgi:L-threonylcarbamoyladenylate synthase